MLSGEYTMVITSRSSTTRRRLARITLVALIAQAALAQDAAGPTISNPKLYESSLKAAAQAMAYYGEPDRLEDRRRVNDIGYRLAAASDYRDAPFTFYLADLPVPNAFALPGGHIFVTRGMLDLGLDDDMLANLLGHELAHVIYQHGTKMKKRATLLNLLSMAALVGVIAGTSSEPENPRDPYGYSAPKNGSMIEGTMAAGMALTELLLRDYSRDFEDEADVEGQRLAAAAGFDPRGAQRLWEVMNARIPESRAYGYWRTHPFSDQRLRAAEVRARQLTILEGPPSEPYRKAVQELMLGLRDEHAERLGDKENRNERDLALVRFLEATAVYARPAGKESETIRLAWLHRRRDAVLEKSELERDYGQLLELYQDEREEVRSVDPETPFLATLDVEIDGLRAAARKLYPQALEVWRGEIYQTPFLETFLSNYPDAPEAPAVALALGDAYSRLRRETDAVEHYLRAAEAGPESEAGRRAIAGLRNLAPYLERLAALQQMADEIGDPELSQLSEKRLLELAPKYASIEVGAEYIERFPDGAHVETVRRRLETLASNLYGEVVLYQGVGDHVKALDLIQKILTHAPFSQAAEQLRERAVYQG